MRQFDFYEFAGILVPGAIVLAAIAVLFADARVFDFFKGAGFGGLGLFVIFAYVAGHIIQAFGNWFEKGWWFLWGGMPTDWVLVKPERLLAHAQTVSLEKAVREYLNQGDFRFENYGKRAWGKVTRQIYAAVCQAGCSGRVDVFNGNYGLYRGLFVAFFFVDIFSALFTWPSGREFWMLIVTAVALPLLVLYRMHRFARHYARELFVQFLQLSTRSDNKEKTQ